MTNQKIKILFVDDEKYNREAFRANFRRKYEIFLCESGAEALELLNNYPEIQIVITDQKMPNMTGIEFLDAISKDLHVIKIVVTAHRDMSLLQAALEDGRIHDFYDKPWRPEILEKLIDEAVDRIINNQSL
jgi:response regulator RpfG family c-di-GMP phosphodiesterase